MANTLLDYLFKITAKNPVAAASTAFLKQVCLVVAPKDGGVTTGVPVLCTSMAGVAALTNNTEAQQLFNAGMTRVYILPMDDLDLEAVMDVYGSDFFTVLVSSDFNDADIEQTAADGTITISSYSNLLTTTPDTIAVAGVTFTAQSTAVTPGDATFRAATGNTETAQSLADQINAHATAKLLVTAEAASGVVTVTAKEVGWGGNDIAVAYTDNGGGNIGATLAGLVGGKLSGGAGLFLGVFDGVTGVASNDLSFLEDQAAIERRCAFYKSGTNNAKNLCYAFGSLLSNALDWTNQQYIQMPFADDVDEVGEAENLFDNKISFVIDDDQYGPRLSLFCAGGLAIVAPYIVRNLEIDMQSKALQYINANEPSYTKKHAALLEDELDKLINGSPDVRGYVQKGWIEEGSVEVLLEQDDFVASGEISIKRPRALWRIVGEITQS